MTQELDENKVKSCWIETWSAFGRSSKDIGKFLTTLVLFFDKFVSIYLNEENIHEHVEEKHVTVYQNNPDLVKTEVLPQ